MSAAKSSAILRHVPSELLEEILLKLPIKSLLRFTTVSKSWLSIISGSRFVQEQKRRAAVNGVKRMVTGLSHNHISRSTSVQRIPHTSLMGNDDSTPLICPIEGGQRRLRASCDGLWLVEAETFLREFAWVYQSDESERSLYLWNPSTRAHRKLPDSLLPTWTTFVFGLGYDSAADDYKVLKIAREESSSSIPTELYSLKSDSWKTISPPPPGIEQQGRCEYVNGSFHWNPTFSNTIVSFDLSTEKYGEIVFPAIALECKYNWNYVEVVVVRGKLCVTVNKYSKFTLNGLCFALWVMEEYGVEKSWTKELNIEYGFSRAFYYPCGHLKPVHFYDNGDILLDASLDGLCMYNIEGARFERIVARDGTTMFGEFIYVESLVSPLPR